VNVALFVIGIGKILFGILVGALGVWLGSRVLARLMRLGEMDEELAKGNMGVAVISAAGLLSLGLLVQHAVSATFAAMDLMYRGQKFAPAMLSKFAFYSLSHVALSLAVGAAAIAVGTFLFVRLTRGVDEIAEIRKGNVAPAIVLGAAMVVIALVAAPGLETALDGLLPLPELARDEVMAPS
jgi:uncharacterized membrane protein YjfL (UPF0719 family)